MEILVHSKQQDYKVLIERGLLSRVNTFIDPKKRVYIISDTGVPQEYKDSLMRQFENSSLFVFPQGEASKNLQTFQAILENMLQENISRNDLIIALGGGVVGDLSGFVAACYKRGISYINIPTTTLSQIDSSIGGKTAVDLAGVKNCVGAFWQPSLVLIDPDTLKSLNKRHFYNGVAEAVKMGLICDRELFELFEKEDAEEHLEEIIYRSLVAKRDVVAQDERESGLRKILNFGHTYGHAFESYYDLGTYLHGECVAMGMMQVLEDPQIKERCKNVLCRLHLPLACEVDKELIRQIMKNDKKAEQDSVDLIQVREIGSAVIEKVKIEELIRRL